MSEQSKTKKPPIVPAEYMGQWIAWDREQTQILASGDTVAETLEAAKAAGEPKPILAKVPRGKSMGAAGCGFRINTTQQQPQ